MEIKTVPFEKIKPGAKCLIPKDAQHKYAGCAVRRLNGQSFSSDVANLIEFAARKNDSADIDRARSMYHNAIYKGETFHLNEEAPVVPIEELQRAY